MTSELPAPIRKILWCNSSLLAALLALFLYWNIFRESGFSAAVLLFQTLPLVALLPGLWRLAYRSYSWLCFVLLFYFIFAVQRVFLSNSHASDFIFLALTVSLFITSMVASRWLQRLQKGVFDQTATKVEEPSTPSNSIIENKAGTK